MVGFMKGLGCGCCGDNFDCPLTTGRSHVEVFQSDPFTGPHPTINLVDSATVSGGVFIANGNGRANTYNSTFPANSPNGNYAYPKLPASKSGRIEFRMRVTAVNELVPNQSWQNQGAFFFTGVQNVAPNFPGYLQATITRLNYSPNSDSFDIGQASFSRQYGVGFGTDYDEVIFFDWTHLTGNTWSVTFGDSISSQTAVVYGSGSREYCCGRAMSWNGFRSINAPTSKDVLVSDVVYTET